MFPNFGYCADLSMPSEYFIPIDWRPTRNRPHRLTVRHPRTCCQQPPRNPVCEHSGHTLVYHTPGVVLGSFHLWILGCSLRLQESFDLPFKNRYIRRPNVFGFDPAIAAYEESDRQAEHSPVKFTNLRVAHANRIVHVEALVEVADRGRPVVHGNADDLQALVSIFVLQFHKTRNFVPAGVTPGCPEVEENYFALVGGEIERSSRQFGKREFRSERMLGDIRNTGARGYTTMPVQAKQSYRDCDGRDGDENLFSQCVVLDGGSVASPILPWRPDSLSRPSASRNCPEYRAPSHW